MPRIHPLTSNEISPSAKTEIDRHLSLYNEPVSAMQATLAHSPKAYTAYMQWYPLYKGVEIILGTRLANLFAYSISKESQCTYCSIIFRKKILDGGENPDDLQLSVTEKSIVDFGSAISKCQGNIADHLFNSIAVNYNNDEIVMLIAFAGQMIAANIFNNVVETCLDDHLQPYIPAAKSIWH